MDSGAGRVEVECSAGRKMSLATVKSSLPKGGIWGRDEGLPRVILIRFVLITFS